MHAAVELDVPNLFDSEFSIPKKNIFFYNFYFMAAQRNFSNCVGNARNSLLTPLCVLHVSVTYNVQWNLNLSNCFNSISRSFISSHSGISKFLFYWLDGMSRYHNEVFGCIHGREIVLKKFVYRIRSTFWFCSSSAQIRFSDSSNVSAGHFASHRSKLVSDWDWQHFVLVTALCQS